MIEAAPIGFCQCGCGQITKISKHSDSSRGYIAGVPRELCFRHRRRKDWSSLYTVDNDTGCWNWNKAIADTGYGITWFKGRLEGAHRVYYKLFKGEIPEGLELDHLCRNRQCVNPEHLEAVTRLVNTLRGAHCNRELEPFRAAA